jgi:2-oxoglutarate ferredoxin oxidoreductase subunit delta
MMSANVKRKKKKLPAINREWCKGCRICVAFCPEDALTTDELEKANLSYPEKCIGCEICELRCPDFAIQLE